jgi:hypothetical protein
MNLSQFCSKGLKLVGLVALCAVALYAADPPNDGGGSKGRGACPGSPENPTLILALLGTSAVAWQYARSRTRL